MKPHFDPVFYKRVYPDLRFLTEAQLQDHFQKFHKSENRVGSELQLSRFIDKLPYPFEVDTYKSLYPDAPSDETLSKIHYYTHGHLESRIYNRQQLTDTNDILDTQIREEIIPVERHHKHVSNPKKDINISNQRNTKRINILIRTHARESQFKTCINSILEQHYDDIHLFICGQTQSDLSYIIKHTSGIENITLIKGKAVSDHDYFFNDFMNQLIDLVPAGWLINLDDDDMFTSPLALSEISQHIAEDVCVIWKYKRPDKLIYPDIESDLSTPGTIASTSYCIHCDKAKDSRWVMKRQGDFDYIQPIYNNMDRKFIDTTLTKYQLGSKTASFGESFQEFTIPDNCQLHTSTSLEHLHNRFIKKYNLQPLNDVTRPCIFFGFYTSKDFETYNNHTGPRYAMFGGSDCDTRISGGRDNIINIRSSLKQEDRILHISNDIKNRIHDTGGTSEAFDLNLVDDTIFTPKDTQGECIFIYNGMNGLGNEKIYGKRYYDVIAETLPEYKYIYSNELHLPYEQMPDIYSQCFIGLRLTDQDGNANMVQEFEAMRLPVVHNSSEYGLKWDDVECIVNHILNHSPQS